MGRSAEEAGPRTVEQVQRQSRDSQDNPAQQYPKCPAANLLVAGEQAMNKDLTPFWQTRSSRFRGESGGDVVSSLGQRAELLKNADGLPAAGGLRNDPVIKDILLGTRSGEYGTLKDGDGIKIAGLRSDTPGDGFANARGDRVRSADLIAAAGSRNPDGVKPGDPSAWTGGMKPDQGKGTDGTSSASSIVRNPDGSSFGPNGPRGPQTDIVGVKDTDGIPAKRGEAAPTVADDFSVKDGRHGTKSDPGNDSGGIFVPDSGLVGIFANRPEKGDKSGDEKDSSDNKSPKKEEERRQRYIVKKGDTLELIAQRMLHNVKLNVLIFEINRNIIPTKLEKGRVLLNLKPKLIIWLPTSKEIKQFCQRAGSGNFRKFDYVADRQDDDANAAGKGVTTNGNHAAAGVRPEAAQLIADDHTTVQDPAGNNGGQQSQSIYDDPFPVPLRVVEGEPVPERKAEPTRSPSRQVPVTAKPSAIPASGAVQAELRPVAQRADIRSSVMDVGENNRLVKLISGDSTCFRLEVRQGEYWLPVISYETSEALSVRHEYLADGRKKTIKIDLPLFAVRELAENDLLCNWSEYSRGFIAMHTSIEVLS